MSKFGVGVGEDFPVGEGRQEAPRESCRGHHHRHSPLLRWTLRVAFLLILVAIGVAIGGHFR